MDTMGKARVNLAVFSAGLTVVLAVFVWFMTGASGSAEAPVLLRSLALLSGVSAAAQVIYTLKGQIFEFDGRLAKKEVLFAIICFQVVMQFSFGFSLYAVNQTELHNAGYDSAYAHFVKLQQSAESNTADGFNNLNLEAGMPAHVERIFVATDGEALRPDRFFSFPVSGGRLVMERSQQYYARHLRSFALSLAMSLVVSVLLMIEVVTLAVKRIDGKRNNAVPNVAGYLRQTAFLFYFAGFFGASFIPVMARRFAESGTGSDFIAGLPYSVEAFANCIAILFTARLFSKLGWKPPYMMGVGLFIAGLAASALSPNVYVFIASRAVVGLGYGFCWMTLRNVASFGTGSSDAGSSGGNRSQNFAELSAGIYAGIMCGVAFGAVLADIIGFNHVLLLSAALSLVAALFPAMLGNGNTVRGSASAMESKTVKLLPKDIIVFVAFLGLIVVPTIVADAFNGFLLPLYINDLGLPIAYAGRVTLVYNLLLVYVSSVVLLKAVQKRIKSPLIQNALHMAIISAALVAAAYLGGFTAVLVAGALLGCADGFGFSVQNSYVLDTRVAQKVGTARMLTFFSLFKKFGAVLAPFVLGMFIADGFGGLGVLAAVFAVCAIVAVVLIILLDKGLTVK